MSLVASSAKAGLLVVGREKEQKSVNSN